jgi:phosphoribosylformylglycinamidine synthase, purS protein
MICRQTKTAGTDRTFNYGQALHQSMAIIDIRIDLKKGVADPEGSNTKKTLEALDFKGIKEVKSVKVFEITLDMSPEEAKKCGEEMCRKLLANPVIQTFSVTVR